MKTLFFQHQSTSLVVYPAGVFTGGLLTFSVAKIEQVCARVRKSRDQTVEYTVP